MINAIDVIDRLPYELAARLTADEFFADIPVLVFERGNVDAELKVKQAVVTTKGTKRGVAVIVTQVVADDEQPEIALGPMTLRPSFWVVEQVILNNDPNGTKKSARKVARRIRDVIKPFRLVGLTTDFIPDSPCIEPVPVPEELSKTLIVYQVNFKTYENDAEQLDLVAMPQFAMTEDEQQLILSCITEGAQIWYTLDDSHPTPTQFDPESTAQLYSGPIDIPVAGVMVRAGAFMPGKIASQVNRAFVELEQITTQQ